MTITGYTLFCICHSDICHHIGFVFMLFVLKSKNVTITLAVTEGCNPLLAVFLKKFQPAENLKDFLKSGLC